MNLQDLDALAKGLAPVMIKLIDAATAPLLARIAQLESATPAAGLTGDPGQDGRDGRDADPLTEAQIAAAVTLYLDANPPAAGKDGRDGIDGANGRDGVDGEKGAPGLDGRDGAAAPVVKAALKDHAGELVLTLSDGAMLRTGIFDGKAGAAGSDGADGLGFDDLVVSLADDQRTVVLAFERGDLQRSFELGFPTVLDRGVYKAEAEYAQGDAVTWGGSLWIAQRATSSRPETSDDWRLAVKRGRDGKEGAAGKDGAPGLKGEPGLNGRSFS